MLQVAPLSRNCKVQGNKLLLLSVTGPYMLVWKKGIAVLAAGPTKVTPDNRIRLVDGYNLEISNVQTQDAGDYACQIATLNPIEIIHTVEILGEYHLICNMQRLLHLELSRMTLGCLLLTPELAGRLYVCSRTLHYAV